MPDHPKSPAKNPTGDLGQFREFYRKPRECFCSTQQRRVPAVYLTSAILAILAIEAVYRISNLRVINSPHEFDSDPRLQSFFGVTSACSGRI
jgi:hypothetical protein